MSIEVGTRFAPLTSSSEPQTREFSINGKLAETLTKSVDKVVSKLEKVESSEVLPQDLQADKSGYVEERIQKILDEINASMYSYNKELHFELNQDTQDIIIRVVNGKTGEVLKQFPSQEIIAMRERLLAGQTTGLNLQSKAN